MLIAFPKPTPIIPVMSQWGCYDSRVIADRPATMGNEGKDKNFNLAEKTPGLKRNKEVPVHHVPIYTSKKHSCCKWQWKILQEIDNFPRSRWKIHATEPERWSHTLRFQQVAPLTYRSWWWSDVRAKIEQLILASLVGHFQRYRVFWRIFCGFRPILRGKSAMQRNHLFGVEIPLSSPNPSPIASPIAC